MYSKSGKYFSLVTWLYPSRAGTSPFLGASFSCVAVIALFIAFSALVHLILISQSRSISA